MVDRYLSPSCSYHGSYPIAAHPQAKGHNTSHLSFSSFFFLHLCGSLVCPSSTLSSSWSQNHSQSHCPPTTKDWKCIKILLWKNLIKSCTVRHMAPFTHPILTRCVATKPSIPKFGGHHSSSGQYTTLACQRRRRLACPWYLSALKVQELLLSWLNCSWPVNVLIAVARRPSLLQVKKSITLATIQKSKSTIWRFKCYGWKLTCVFREQQWKNGENFRGYPRRGRTTSGQTSHLHMGGSLICLRSTFYLCSKVIGAGFGGGVSQHRNSL